MSNIRIELNLTWEPSDGGKRFTLRSDGTVFGNLTLVTVYTPAVQSDGNYGQWWGYCNAADSGSSKSKGKWFPTLAKAQAYGLKQLAKHCKKNKNRLIEET